MIESILESVKKTLMLDPDYDVFDEDILMHINSTFFTLHQLGVGPEDGFMIEDKEAKWTDYIQNDKDLLVVKTYIQRKVKLLFDPPTNSFGITAIETQIKELEWRIATFLDIRRHVEQQNELLDEAPLIP